jgi:hypothetical protein
VKAVGGLAWSRTLGSLLHSWMEVRVDGLDRGAMPEKRMLLLKPWLRLRPSRSLFFAWKRTDASRLRHDRDNERGERATGEQRTDQ